MLEAKEAKRGETATLHPLCHLHQLDMFQNRSGRDLLLGGDILLHPRVNFLNLPHNRVELVLYIKPLDAFIQVQSVCLEKLDICDGNGYRSDSQPGLVHSKKMRSFLNVASGKRGDARVARPNDEVIREGQS